MKAFLLAAGHGTRLRPLTRRIPKCLLPIRGMPLLAIWLEIFRRYGLDEVLVNLHEHAEMVREFLAGSNQGTKVRLFEEPCLLGSAGTLRANRDWVASEPSFWVFYADILTTANLAQMEDFHRRHNGIATMGVCRVADPSRSGIAVVDQAGLVRQFIEKPAQPPSDLAFAGILLAQPELLDYIPEKRPADLAFDVLPQLAGRVFAYRIAGYHLDIGTPESYQAAQTNWPGLAARTQTMS